MNVNANDLIWYGRNLNHNGIRYFDYSCSGFCFVKRLEGLNEKAVDFRSGKDGFAPFFGA